MSVSIICTYTSHKEITSYRTFNYCNESNWMYDACCEIQRTINTASLLSWEIWLLKSVKLFNCILLTALRLSMTPFRDLYIVKGLSVLFLMTFSAGITQHMFSQLLTFLRSSHYWCQKVKCMCNNLGWRAHSEFIVQMRNDYL